MSEQQAQVQQQQPIENIRQVLGGQIIYPNDNKEVFGPHYWFSLHNSAAHYPEYPTEKDRENYRGLFNTLVRDVPCTESCRIHTRDYVRLHPLEPNLESKEKLFDYLCHFHNYVNRLNGKQVYECSTMLSNRAGSTNKDDSLQTKQETTQTEGRSNDENIQQGEGKGGTPKKPTSVHRDSVGSSFEPIRRRGDTDNERDIDKYSGMPNSIDQVSSTSGRSEKASDSSTSEQKGSNDTSNMSINSSTNNGGTPAADTESMLQSLFNNHKQLTTEIAKVLCRKEGVKEPRSIKFAPCPDPQHANTSCVFKNQDGSLTIYNNPYNYGLRSAVHEIHHYIRQMKGFSDMSEQEAEDYARSTIHQYYPHDNEPQIVMTPANNYTSTDSVGANETKNSGFEDPENGLRSRHSGLIAADEIGGSAEDDVFMRFPKLKAHMEEIEAKKKAEEDRKLATEGLLSHLDHVYEMPGSWMGITGSQLNTIATPIILQNIISTVVESNTTSLGAMAINMITGLSITAALAISKASISHRDKLLLTGLASAFLFSSVKYANPKVMEELKSLIVQVNAKMNMNDYDGMWNLFIETPGMHRFNKNIGEVQNATGTGVRTDPRVAMARAHARQGTVAIPERNTIQNMESGGGEFQVIDNTSGMLGPETMGVDNVISARRNPASRIQLAGGDEGRSIFG